jgi:SAM-dependent methyltransferase
MKQRQAAWSAKPNALKLPLICSDAETPAAATTYDPLPSVWFGEDSELIDRMLRFYPRKKPKDILDATVNGGRFWKDLPWKIIGMDIDPAHNPTVVGDNRDMPFEDSTFDVVVYDPPHVPNQGRDQSKDFNVRFGLVLKASKEQEYDLGFLYPPFVAEAYRVLRPEGILLCKIADYIHGHCHHWAHIDVIQAAQAVGFCACDCIVKVRQGPIIDPRWKVAHHARRQHCYWLIFRKSKKCE